jgi:hypothetical protein
MKLGWLFLALVVGGCTQIGAQAPNYAIGTYRGAVIGRGACRAPAADLTVTIGTTSVSGNWYFEQDNVVVPFGTGWVHDAGYLSSRHDSAGGMEFLTGYYVGGGAAVTATIDDHSCIYSGTLARIA